MNLLPVPENFYLSQGSHGSFEGGACVMEVVSYVAGESFTDHPRCACPSLTEVAITLNDCLGDGHRQLLMPLIPLLAGSRSTVEVETKRVYAMLDATVREVAPLVYEFLNCPVVAQTLRERVLAITDAQSAKDASHYTTLDTTLAEVYSGNCDGADYLDELSTALFTVVRSGYRYIESPTNIVFTLIEEYCGLADSLNWEFQGLNGELKSDEIANVILQAFKRIIEIKE